MIKLRVKAVIFRIRERTIQIKTMERQPQAEIPVDIAIRIIKPMLDDPFRKYFIEAVKTIMKMEWVHVHKIDENISMKDFLDFLIFLLECHYFYTLITQSASTWKNSAWKHYTPDNLDQTEGPKEARDRRHKPLLELVSGKVVLDIGAGFGRLEVDLDTRGAKRIVAIDISLRFLSMIEGYLKRQGISLHIIDRVCCDICYLPFRDRTFDLEVAIGVLWHVPFIEKALKEISSVLSRDGLAFLEFQERLSRYSQYVPKFWVGSREYLENIDAKLLCQKFGLKTVLVTYPKVDYKIYNRIDRVYALKLKSKELSV